MSELLEALRLHQPLPRQIDHAAADAAFIALNAAKTAKASAAQVAFDSRAEPEQIDEDEDPVRASDEAMEVAGRADRAWQAGQRAAAADLYRMAADMLQTAAERCEVA